MGSNKVIFYKNKVADNVYKVADIVYNVADNTHLDIARLLHYSATCKQQQKEFYDNALW